MQPGKTNLKLRHHKVVLFILAISIFSACQNDKNEIALKIMSYNIRHGEGLDGILDLSRSAELISKQAPHLCALQEIDNFCQRTDSVDQTGYLAEKTRMQGFFGKFMNYQSGEYGMATLSALPIKMTKNLRLPDGKYEPRSSIVNEVQLDANHNLIFANVHFDWIDSEEGSANRLEQAKALVNYLDESGMACIIAGDFNCPPGSPTMKYFGQAGFVFVDKGVDNLSFQGKSKAEIDHVIFRNSDKVKFKLDSAYLIKEPNVSDHRPLIVELVVSLN